jgi:CheY-like chemotaxis protein
MILTDGLMPNGDGLETTQKLRREFPDVKNIVFTAGTADRSFIDLANGTLKKPFELRDLLDTVRRVLQK